jgi:hypothetical protein
MSDKNDYELIDEQITKTKEKIDAELMFEVTTIMLLYLGKQINNLITESN